jgi:hypothetical protein
MKSIARRALCQYTAVSKTHVLLLLLFMLLYAALPKVPHCRCADAGHVHPMSPVSHTCQQFLAFIYLAQGCKPAPQVNLLTCVTAARRGSTADHIRLLFTTQRGPANGSISPNQEEGTALPFWQKAGCSNELSDRMAAISGWVVSSIDCNRARGVSSSGDVH